MEVTNFLLECILPMVIVFAIIVIVAIWPSKEEPDGT